jgi:hypothetical protein
LFAPEQNNMMVGRLKLTLLDTVFLDFFLVVYNTKLSFSCKSFKYDDKPRSGGWSYVSESTSSNKNTAIDHTTLNRLSMQALPM